MLYLALNANFSLHHQHMGMVDKKAVWYFHSRQPVPGSQAGQWNSDFATQIMKRMSVVLLGYTSIFGGQVGDTQ